MVQRLSAIAFGDRGASAVTWDPNDGALKRDGRVGAFDLVVSIYGITRLELDEGGLGRLHNLLAPGGCLLAAEPEQSDVWSAVFGQNAKWWQGSLTSDFPISPIRGSAGLTELMTGAGLADIGAQRIGEGLWPVTMLSGRRRRKA